MVTRKQAQLRLASAEWLADSDLQRIFALLDGEQKRVRAVGGIVRDTILARDRENTDIDLATEIEPRIVMQRAASGGIAAYPTGITHGTVTLRAGRVVAEVTTLREDVETDGRHAVVRFGTDWSRDAARRDFTMNALYADADGSLFDPLDGLADCLGARVRFIGDPNRRIAEDALRIFRFFRFSASHGGQQFDSEGLAACARAIAEHSPASPHRVVEALSAERIGAEMTRTLRLPRVVETLATMAAIGAMTVPCDIDAQRRYEQLATFPTTTARLALLLRDSTAEQVQAAWRLSNQVRSHAEDVLAAAELLVLGAFNEAGFLYRGVLREAIPVAGAISDWDLAKVRELETQEANLAVPVFPLAGGDLIALGLKPGKALGQELKRLEADWIGSAFRLNRAQLLARARIEKPGD